MTVEAYFKGAMRGFPIDIETMEFAAFSPTEVGLKPLSLSDDVDELMKDEELSKSLKYALSTLYYSASSYFTGYSQSEQVGDVRASISNFTIDFSYARRWWMLANRLRKELGFEPEEELTESSATMFDATPLARRPKGSCGCH